jgi:hypothetical protein
MDAVPAAHGVQLAAPVVGPNVPAPQGAQAVAPAAE